MMMKKMDTTHIKEMTNQIIGYENFKQEEIMKKNKLQKIAFVLTGISFLSIGTITVNALTDNAITDAVKEIMPISVITNNQEEKKNATCKKLDNGHISCIIDEEVIEGEDQTTIQHGAKYEIESELPEGIDMGMPEIIIEYNEE